MWFRAMGAVHRTVTCCPCPCQGACCEVAGFWDVSRSPHPPYEWGPPGWLNLVPSTPHLPGYGRVQAHIYGQLMISLLPHSSSTLARRAIAVVKEPVSITNLFTPKKVKTPIHQRSPHSPDKNVRSGPSRLTRAKQKSPVKSSSHARTQCPF